MATSSTSPPVRPQRILIIGGGPAGLVTLRNLTERGDFERIELVERRDDVGGVWYLDNPSSSTASTRPRFPSPAYPGLIGNVLPEFLSFSECPFPLPPSSPNQPFPTLIETHAYLRAFAAPYLQSGAIRLNREVVSVEELAAGEGWRVVIRDWSAGGEGGDGDGGKGKGREVEERWDAVVGAVGWYDNPVWPETEGLAELRANGLANHAKWWRGPQGHEGKRTLVVGNANSANDIAAQLVPISTTPVYQSVRRVAFPGFPSLPDERIAMVAPVARYAPTSTGKFDAHLTDGRVLRDLDYVWLGTGYRVYTDFIRVLDPEAQHEKENSLEAQKEPPRIPLISPPSSPHRIPALHQLILYAHNPSLAFIGAPMTYTPFPLFDLCSTWLCLTWLGVIPYPPSLASRLQFEIERMEEMERKRKETGNPSSLMVFSVLGKSEEGYAAGLRREVVGARPGLGGVLQVWNKERTAVREGMYAVKLEALRWAKERGEQERA